MDRERCAAAHTDLVIETRCLDLDALRRMRREPVHVYCPLCSRTHRYLLADAVESTFECHELPAFLMARHTEA